MYGVDMETKSTLFWGSDSLDLLKGEKRDKAKSSRPRRIYAAAGQSVGGDSRHLSNAYEMQNAKINSSDSEQIITKWLAESKVYMDQPQGQLA